VDENVPSELLGDENHVKQILNNLISNAYMYTTTGEVEMSVTAESVSDKAENTVMLVFNVRDTGQGMTAEQVDKLFDEYSRSNPEAGRTIEGTGLDMSILQHLTHIMKGEISVESKPDKGSCFTVRLPQGITGSSVMGKEKAEKLKQFRSNYEAKMEKEHIVHELMPEGKVLIVDDIDINLYVVTEMLLLYGLHVDSAMSGAEAVEKIKQNDYNLVFMDHIMPIMDGIETTKRIRQLGKKYEDIPIIALTANAGSGVKEMFLANGFNGFISKPLSIHELDAVLKEWIR
jgi:CheY-like chemotaxis protein